MKTVVDAVSAILDDAQDSDSSRPQRERCQATLNNLLTAARTHATSYGMSPVSLLDAAASHVALSVTELGKSLRLRRATKAEVEEWDRRQASGSTPKTNGTPTTNGNNHSHTPSVATLRDYGSSNGSPMSQKSSPAVATRGGSAWAELRPYVQTQADAILQGVSAVLANARAPGGTGVNDSIVQIITSVGSVVAACEGPDSGSVPPRVKALVRDLGDYADQLSNAAPPAGSNAELSKEARHAISKCTLDISGAVRELVKL